MTKKQGESWINSGIFLLFISMMAPNINILTTNPVLQAVSLLTL